MLNPVTRALLDALGIDKRAPLPRFAAQTFRQQMRNTRQPAQTRKAVFFPGAATWTCTIPVPAWIWSGH